LTFLVDLAANVRHARLFLAILVVWLASKVGRTYHLPLFTPYPMLDKGQPAP
jgi:hypothetical protein